VFHECPVLLLQVKNKVLGQVQHDTTSASRQELHPAPVLLKMTTVQHTSYMDLKRKKMHEKNPHSNQT